MEAENIDTRLSLGPTDQVVAKWERFSDKNYPEGY